MASSDSIGLRPVVPVDSQGPTTLPATPELRRDDIRRVRRYCRAAAALKAIVTFALVVLVAWLLDRWFDTPWVDLETPRPFAVAAVVAVAGFALAEKRLRTYDVRLGDGAVTFAYGRKYFYLPITHLQLIDAESSPLLRPMGLSRCILHTAGGMVVISPVPIRFVSAIERATLDQRAGHPDAT